MELDVDKQAILDDWRARQRHRGRVLVQYDAPVADQMRLVHLIRTVAERLNEDSASSHRRPRFDAEPAVLTSRGPSLFVRFSKPPALDVFLEDLAAGLRDHPGTALLTSGGETEPKPWATTDSHELLGLYGILAVSGWGQSEHRKAVAPWRVSADLAPDIAQLADHWLRAVPGYLTVPMGTSDPVPQDRLVPLVETIAADLAGPPLTDVSKTGAREARRLTLTVRGDILLYARIFDEQLARTYCALEETLRIWAPRCDFTAISPGDFRGAAEITQLLERARLMWTLPYYVNNRRLDREYLPDVFGWQTVTGAQLDKIDHPEERWTVRQLDNDCYEVASRDPLSWRRTESPYRLSGVDESTLSRARSDFRNVILTSNRVQDV